MIKKFLTKRVEVLAVQVMPDNIDECVTFCKVACEAVSRSSIYVITAHDGILQCNIGDWIVKSPSDSNDFFVMTDVEFSAAFDPSDD